MPISVPVPTILPQGILNRLSLLEGRINYMYSQDRIDTGLDKDGNDTEEYLANQAIYGGGGPQLTDVDTQSDMNWLLKVLTRLEEIAPEDESEDETEADALAIKAGIKIVTATTTTTTIMMAGKKASKKTAQEQDFILQHALLTERVAACVAHFCGRAASGAMTRTWTFHTTPKPRSLKIHDPSFTEGDVGFKTFGSAYLLSKHIAHDHIPQLSILPQSNPTSVPTSPTSPKSSNSGSNQIHNSNGLYNTLLGTSPTTLTTLNFQQFPQKQSRSLPRCKILELGSGTGLVGFTASLYADPMQTEKVILSDYHPNVVSTLFENCRLNHLESKSRIQTMDWIDTLNRRRKRFTRQSQQQRGNEVISDDEGEGDYDELPESERMDLILGAEVIYDHGHAELVANMVDEYLRKSREIRGHNKYKVENDQKDHGELSLLPRPAFHIMFPIRKTHTDIFAELDFWMEKMNLVDVRKGCKEATQWGREDGDTKFLYHWREYVRREHIDADGR